jgi:hypothetical protein
MPSGSTTGSHSVFAMLKKCLPSVASPFHTRPFDTGVAGLDLSMLDLCAGNRDASGISSIFWSRSIETLKHQGQVPWQLVTDKLRAYRAAHREIFPSVVHQTGCHENNLAEVSHQHTREQKRQIRRFKSPRQAQRFLSVHGLIKTFSELVVTFSKQITIDSSESGHFPIGER